MINDQYVLKKNSNFKALIKHESTIEIWHAYLRHLDYDNLIKLENQTIEIILNESKSNQICEFCMIDRQKRNVNKTSWIRVIKFLKIVHSDLERTMPRIRDDYVSRYYDTEHRYWETLIIILDQKWGNSHLFYSSLIFACTYSCLLD
jgi:hypothetical protein